MKEETKARELGCRSVTCMTPCAPHLLLLYRSLRNIYNLIAPSRSHLDHGLQLDGVGSELADAVRELLHGHAVLVVLPAEFFLIQVNLLQITGLG